MNNDPDERQRELRLQKGNVFSVIFFFSPLKMIWILVLCNKSCERDSFIIPGASTICLDSYSFFLNHAAIYKVTTNLNIRDPTKEGFVTHFFFVCNILQILSNIRSNICCINFQSYVIVLLYAMSREQSDSCIFHTYIRITRELTLGIIVYICVWYVLF